MDVRKLIPKDKFDKSSIVELRRLSFEELRPIIPNLLEWLQDANWPISSEVANILRPFAARLTDEIIAILRTNDGMWKYWTLSALARNTKDINLLVEIRRIAEHPTSIEIEDGVQEEARAIIQGEHPQQT